MALRDPAVSSIRPLVRLPAISGMKLLTIGVVAVLTYLIIVPLGVQLLTAFRGPHLPFSERARTGVENFITIYTTGGFVRTLHDTAIFVGGAVAVSFVIGFMLAWLVERTDLANRRLLFVLVLVPAIMPPIVLAQAWMQMLAPQFGVFNQAIRTILPFWETGPINPFSFPAMILVQGLSGVTFFFLLLCAALRNMDGSLEEASRASGGGTLQTLRRVTVPIMLPSILAVIVLNAIITAGQFEVPLLFGISAGAQVFSLRIWQALHPAATGIPFYGQAAAYGVNFLVITYALFYLYARITTQANKYATITGKGYRPTRLQLGRWKFLAFLFIGGYLLLILVVPLLTLFWTSLLPFYQPFSWTVLTQTASFDAYRVVFIDSQFWGGLWRSFLVASLSATIAVTLALITAWVVVRAPRGIGTRVLDLFTSSSVAIPSAVAAFALFVFYISISRWVPLFGTVWLLVLAYAFRTAVAYRISYAGVLQINRELEEASMTSGASPLATLRRVVMPLLLPHAFMAWLILFFLGTHEFTIAVFLSSERSATLPVVLFNRLSTASGGAAAPNQAAAIAVLFTLLMALITFVAAWLVSRRGVRRG